MSVGGGLEYLERGLQALGAIGEFEPVHDAGHDDIGEKQVELDLENLQPGTESTE